MRGSRWRSVASILVLALALSSCRLSAARGSSESSHDPVLPVVTCTITADVPSGWTRTSRIEVPGRDRIGVREVYRRGGGRGLHLTAGIEGEIGEALPVSGRPQVIGGSDPRLLGVRGGKLWVLVWTGQDRCGTRSATGVGIGRDRFVALLRRSDVLV